MNVRNFVSDKSAKILFESEQFKFDNGEKRKILF